MTAALTTIQVMKYIKAYLDYVMNLKIKQSVYYCNHRIYTWE